MTDSNSTPRTDRTDDSGTADSSNDDSVANASNTEPVGDARSATQTDEQSRQSTDRPSQPNPASHEENQRRLDGDNEAAFRCRHCGDPFVEKRHLALHRGLRHADDLSGEELEAYRDAYADEEADLKRFRLVALGALVVLYFGFLFVYALVP